MHHQKVDENLFAALALDDDGGDGERPRSLEQLSCFATATSNPTQQGRLTLIFS